MLNSVYRKNYLNNLNFKVYIIGLGLNYLNYKIINLGSSLICFNKYILGLLIVNKYFLFNDYYNLSFFNKNHFFSKNILIGSSSLIRNDSNTIINSIWNLFKLSKISIKNINILSRNLGRISAYEFNVLYNIKSATNITKINKKDYFNFFIGVDNLCNSKKNNKNINIFLGSFFIINFFEFINLIFSSSIYVEDIFSYLNLEGRFRYTNKVITPAKYIYSDYKIINSLNILLKKIYLWNFSVINNYNNIMLFFIKNYNFFINYNIKYKNIVKYYLNNIIINNVIFDISNNYNNYYNMKNANTILSKIIYNYYNTDIFCKLSPSVSLMALKINYKNFN